MQVRVFFKKEKLIAEDQRSRDGYPFNMEVKPFSELSSDNKLHISEKERQDWGFAFSYASRSSKSILVALQWLHRLSPYEYFDWKFVGTNWNVSEMVEWLKVCTEIVLIRET